MSTHAPLSAADVPRSRPLKPLIVAALSACYLATVVVVLPPSLDPRPHDRIAITVTAMLSAAGGIAVVAYVATHWAASPSHVGCLAAAVAGTALACLHLLGPDSGLPQGLGYLAVAVLAVCGAVGLAPSTTGARPSR